MEHHQVDGGKKLAKSRGETTSRGSLQRGWTRVESPLTALQDPVAAAGTPRSVAATSANRLTLPSPTEYPRLFDVRGPSSARAADVATPRQVGAMMPQSARGFSSVSTRSWSTARRIESSSNGWLDHRKSDRKEEEEEEGRLHLPMRHHNLHSVLSNPKAPNWGDTLLEALYPALDTDITVTLYPDLEDEPTYDFQTYLRRFGTNAAKFERNHGKPVREQLSSSSVPSVAVADEDRIKCLKAVPTLFFRPDFDLSNPDTFQKVMNGSNSASLQAELTAYLDRVQLTLLRQVSSRSDRFFEASVDQEVMKRSIKAACDQVATLRKTMNRLQNSLADRTLGIVSLHRRQKRIKMLHDIVAMIEEVKGAESAVEALVQCQDYTSALNLIENSQAILREHLQGVCGLHMLSEKFHSYRDFISRQLSQRFISIITTSTWTFDTSDENRQERFDDERDDIHSTMRLVDVLFRLDALIDTMRTYHDQLNEEVRLVVKTVVTETISVSSSSKSSSSTDRGSSSGSEPKVSVQLRALTSDEFLQCVQMIFEHLQLVLKRAVVVQDVLVKSMQQKIDQATVEENRPETVVNDGAHSNSIQESQDSKGVLSEGWASHAANGAYKTLDGCRSTTMCAKVIREIDEVVRKICEFSQRSVSNLFAVRKDVQAVYTMAQLRKLYDTTMDFVVNMEKLTGKTDYTLRGALFSQLKLFLEKTHQVQVTKLMSTLDHELWKSTEISEARHRLLDNLSRGRGVAVLPSNDREIDDKATPPRKMVSICGKSFRVVWSVLLMLEIVVNHLSCAANFPVLATDVLQRCIEIFRVYNTRTTQLVLGAGAMQIARLKSISSRHLALVSQSLELSMTLLPHIKAALAAHFTDRQKRLLDEFDRVLRDYAEHNEKIFSKFTSIVEDQIMKRFLENAATEVDYDSATLAIPTAPMSAITQNTLKLYAVLHPILSPPQMKDVMSRVFDMFVQKLPDCYKLVQPGTAAGKKRVIEDVEAFVQSFNKVVELPFDGSGLLRHFKSTYCAS